MKRIITCVFLLIVSQSKAQEPLLNLGDRFPDMVITDMSNAPVEEFYLNRVKDGKFYILNFWGTWCGPCIPEMAFLAKLQQDNTDNIQVIAISDDGEERKANYLKNNPSDIWLATDSNYTLYNMFQFGFVGQSAIIDSDKKIVGLVRTHSINQSLIDKLLQGDTITMDADMRKKIAVSSEGDPFAVDTLMSHSFTLSGYKEGRSGSIGWYTGNTYKDRRISMFNTTVAGLYRRAYGIYSNKVQELYDEDVSEADVRNYENKEALYCIDLLIRPEQRDSLFILLQQYLHANLPIKVRLETKEMPVYVLQRNSEIVVQPSSAEKSLMMFSGRGYDGTRVLVKDFAEEYLTNELGLPVVDETGLEGYYDIKTNVEQRNREGIMKSIEELGFTIEKTEREMPVIVYYRE